MGSIHLTYRLAALPDMDELRALMDASIAELQKPFLDARQVESIRAIVGLDTQLVSDGTASSSRPTPGLPGAEGGFAGPRSMAETRRQSGTPKCMPKVLP